MRVAKPGGGVRQEPDLDLVRLNLGRIARPEPRGGTQSGIWFILRTRHESPESRRHFVPTAAADGELALLRSVGCRR